jgi:hypothetical protein
LNDDLDDYEMESTDAAVAMSIDGSESLLLGDNTISNDIDVKTDATMLDECTGTFETAGKRDDTSSRLVVSSGECSSITADRNICGTACDEDQVGKDDAKPIGQNETSEDCWPSALVSADGLSGALPDEATKEEMATLASSKNAVHEANARAEESDIPMESVETVMENLPLLSTASDDGMASTNVADLVLIEHAVTDIVITKHAEGDVFEETCSTRPSSSGEAPEDDGAESVGSQVDKVSQDKVGAKKIANVQEHATEEEEAAATTTDARDAEASTGVQSDTREHDAEFSFYGIMAGVMGSALSTEGNISESILSSTTDVVSSKNRFSFYTPQYSMDDDQVISVLALTLVVYKTCQTDDYPLVSNRELMLSSFMSAMQERSCITVAPTPVPVEAESKMVDSDFDDWAPLTPAQKYGRMSRQMVIDDEYQCGIYTGFDD